MRARLLMMGVLAAGLMALPMNHAVVAAQKPTTTTTQYDESFTDTDDICGTDVEIQVDQTVLEHVTDFGGGRRSFTRITRGTATFELDGVAYTAQFHFTYTENDLRKASNETQTFHANAFGDDGSRIMLRGRFHFTWNANGELTSEADVFAETCPD